jgi:hypothetical protein
LVAEARDLKTKVDPVAVKSHLADLVADDVVGATYRPLPHDLLLKRLLLTPGLPHQAQEDLMAIALLELKVERARLENAERNISGERVRRYYAVHRRRFHVPDARRLEMMGGSKGAMIQARHEIEDGKPFLEVAQPSLLAEAPGGLWDLVRGRDEPQVERPVFAAKPHVLIGPDRYSTYYLFEVLEVIPAHEQTLAEAEAVIRRALAPSPERLARNAEQRSVSHTLCSVSYLVDGCSEVRQGK